MKRDLLEIVGDILMGRKKKHEMRIGKGESKNSRMQRLEAYFQMVLRPYTHESFRNLRGRVVFISDSGREGQFTIHL